MATDPHGGTPWTILEQLTSAQVNTIRANQLIQLDTDGGSRAMAAKLTLTGADRFELGDKLLYTVSTVTRKHPLIVGFLNANHSIDSFVNLKDGTAGAAHTSVLILNLPNGAVIKTIGVRFSTSLAHTGQPAVMPVVTFQRRPMSTGIFATVATYTDVWVNIATYDTAPRSITITGLSETIDNTANLYYLSWTSESGANSQDNSLVIGVEYTAEITQQDKA